MGSPVDTEKLIFMEESQLINAERMIEIAMYHSATLTEQARIKTRSKQVGEKDDRKMCHLHTAKESPYKENDRCKVKDATYHAEIL